MQKWMTNSSSILVIQLPNIPTSDFANNFVAIF